jgi:hypothetical protein
MTMRACPCPSRPADRASVRTICGGSQRHPALRQRAVDLAVFGVVVKTVGGRQGPAQTGSWQPSSETHEFEHREPARRAEGAIQGDPGRRD